MSDISKFDANFKVDIPANAENITFYDVEEAPFKVYGLMRENDAYCRMPEAVTENVSAGVHHLAKNTAGGRVRFTTDSTAVHIFATMNGIGRMVHFALTGSVGFDMYIDEGEGAGSVYCKTFLPAYDIEEKYEGFCEFKTAKKRVITLNFPLYSGVKKLFVGVVNGSELSEAPDYKTEKPVVFYGSSITQGGCASRAGISYEAILSRELDMNYTNLGFSGSAKGEPAMADYLAGLDMTAFVMDYDHNANSPRHLRETHKAMFDKVRAAHPELPILILTRPKPRKYYDYGENVRFDVIKETYTAAVEAGDKNVYFIDGGTLIADEFAESYSVDGIHPNDIGFFSMAKVMKPTIEKMLGR